MINEVEMYANALLATHREDKKVPWTDLQNCFLKYGRQSADMARRFWKKVEARGEGYKLVGAPNSSDLPKSQWDHLKATSLGLVDGLKGLLRRTPQKIPVENDDNRTRVPTQDEQRIARIVTDRMNEKNLSPAERALLTAVEDARTVDQLLNAIDAAITAKVEAYPKGSRQKLAAIKKVLTRLKDAEKASMEEATAVWNAVSRFLPTEIRNGFQFEPMTPDGKPMLQREVPRI